MGNKENRGLFRKRLLILLLLILLGLFAQLFLENPRATKLKASTVNRINQYLQDTTKMRELRALQIQVENAQSAPKLNNSDMELASIVDGDRKYGVDLVQDRHPEDVYEQTKGSQGMDTSDLPQERIDARLLHRKWMNDYDKRLNKQYVEAFLANAREAGYEVILNDNLDVVAVRRAPQSVTSALEVSSGGMKGAN